MEKRMNCEKQSSVRLLRLANSANMDLCPPTQHVATHTMAIPTGLIQAILTRWAETIAIS
jgi:hypothetical protein